MLLSSFLSVHSLGSFRGHFPQTSAAILLKLLEVLLFKKYLSISTLMVIAKIDALEIKQIATSTVISPGNSDSSFYMVLVEGIKCVRRQIYSTYFVISF